MFAIDRFEKANDECEAHRSKKRGEETRKRGRQDVGAETKNIMREPIEAKDHGNVSVMRRSEE